MHWLHSMTNWRNTIAFGPSVVRQPCNKWTAFRFLFRRLRTNQSPHSLFSRPLSLTLALSRTASPNFAQHHNANIRCAFFCRSAAPHVQQNHMSSQRRYTARAQNENESNKICWRKMSKIGMTNFDVSFSFCLAPKIHCEIMGFCIEQIHMPRAYTYTQSHAFAGAISAVTFANSNRIDFGAFFEAIVFLLLGRISPKTKNHLISFLHFI